MSSIWVVGAAGCAPGAEMESDRDPCDPNPCKQTGKSSCEVVDKKAVCACDDGLVSNGTGGCASTDSWSPGIAGSSINSSGAQDFTAHVRIVNGDGEPIEGATLRVGTRALKTDVEGRGGFTKLPADALSSIRISADGYVPVVRQLSIANAGLRERSIELVEQAKAQKFDAASRTTLQAGNVGLMLPARAFVGSDRKRIQGEIAARITSFAPSALADRAWPGDRQARNASGEPTLVERWLGGVHAEFADAQGTKLQLGPGSTAMLSIDLPTDAPVAKGDSIALWALDETAGLWLQESSCSVAVEGSGAGARKVCAGVVSHFSTWAAGIEWDIYKPGSVGCLNVTLDVQLPAEYAANTQDIHVMQCKGEECSASVMWSEGQALYLHDDQGHPEALCGVTSASSDVRVVVQLQVEQKQKTSGSMLAGGTYMYVTEPVNLQSFKEKLGSQVMLNQTFEPASDCQLLCAQVAITLDESALEGLPRYADEDADHYFVAEEGQSVPPLLGKADCNDKDSRVHPYAFELGCGGIDYDCDGVIPPEEQVSWRDVQDPWLWNNKLCPASCATKDAAETSGNLYDEDCDGRVEDPDGDGFTYYAEPRDCDETSAEAHPGGQEVAGNRIDEDCDGYALDYDGDGYFAWGQEWAALEQLGVDPDKSPERFGDCHDGDPSVHPGVAIEKEVGPLQRLYRQIGDGRYARTEQFCSYFNDDGRPNSYLYYLMTDRNCDGFVTDMDGDGWTDPRDQSLGAARAFDCNDLDPRIHPNEGGALDASGKPKCETPPASQLIDDAVCPVNGTVQPEGCSPLPIDGQSVPTTCYNVPNNQGLELNYCIYDGWETGNPLKWKPGQAWGPCDGGAQLPACPAGYQCGGRQPYSKELEAYLMDKYTDGKPIEYRGMCFKLCKPEKK
ncbi:MAG TPA: MopE-related protein [Polyangiales bacterium]|nr:MopE-related protein [Polyangiales bacterium]